MIHSPCTCAFDKRHEKRETKRTGNRTLNETKCTDNVAGIKQASIKIGTGVSTSCASYLSQGNLRNGKEICQNDRTAKVYIKRSLFREDHRLHAVSGALNSRKQNKRNRTRSR